MKLIKVSDEAHEALCKKSYKYHRDWQDEPKNMYSIASKAILEFCKE